MKVKIVAVGKIKEDFFRQAIAEYTKRLSRFAKVEVVETDECLFSGTPNAKEIQRVLETEGKAILQKCEGYIFALDIGGTMVSSTDLATSLDQLKQTNSTFTFVIGGSNGLSDEVKQKANKRISFGKITLPHQLCRVVLCEQIYRSFCILNNIPYHK